MFILVVKITKSSAYGPALTCFFMYSVSFLIATMNNEALNMGDTVLLGKIVTDFLIVFYSEGPFVKEVINKC